MLWDGMPSEGWIVNPFTRACQCRFHFKFGMCIHVMKASNLLNLPCPGMPLPLRKFISRRKQTRTRRRRRQIHNISENPENESERTHLSNEIIYGPHLQSTQTATDRVRLRSSRNRSDRHTSHYSTTLARNATDLVNYRDTQQNHQSDLQLPHIPYRVFHAGDAFISDSSCIQTELTCYQNCNASSVHHVVGDEGTQCNAEITIPPVNQISSTTAEYQQSTNVARQSCPQTKRRC
ncbi:hypothetical protein PHMEG_00031381 [Phytophthora megakarya]|uniref:SWIM-type domain-containing protein n=1 Tax=Phytophthora megakarya TaxID=4795 RepID=A0A225V0K9_9STRA|nr:hypothetical protein PHMEG_00031381 [Phytophthora megakarya]